MFESSSYQAVQGAIIAASFRPITEIQVTGRCDYASLVANSSSIRVFIAYRFPPE